MIVVFKKGGKMKKNDVCICQRVQVRLGKHKTGHRAEGNQMSTVDRCFSRTWNMRDHITAEYVSDDM